MTTAETQGERVRASEADESSWLIHWPDYMPALVLVGAMMVAWLAHLPSGMTSWGVSAAALAQGRYQTIALHVFAHGGWSHVIMNSASLLEIGGLVVARLGAYPRGWTLFLVVFSLAGLSSMLLFLAFHPQGTTPLIGASGAIFGLVGLLLFMRLSDELDWAESREIPHAATKFIRNNIFFLLLLLVSALLAGLSGGIAWEAHLGGFLLGFCIGPWLVPIPPRPTAE